MVRRPIIWLRCYQEVQVDESLTRGSIDFPTAMKYAATVNHQYQSSPRSLEENPKGSPEGNQEDNPATKRRQEDVTNGNM